MADMLLTLPDGLKDFVDEQAAEQGFGTSGDYLRDLILKEQDRQHLRRLLLEGAASPAAGPADTAWFEELQQHARKHAKA